MTTHNPKTHPPAKANAQPATKTDANTQEQPLAQALSPLLAGLKPQPRQVLALQRTLGNQAVMRLFNRAVTPAPAKAIQRGLDGEMREYFEKEQGYRAVTVLRDLSEFVTKGSQWWLNPDKLREIREAQVGETVDAQLDNGDGDGYFVKISAQDISYDLNEYEKKKMAKEQAHEIAKKDPRNISGFKQVLKNHAMDRAAVEDVLNNAQTSGDLMLINSVALIRKGVVKVYVYSATHDSDKRVEEDEKSSEKYHAIFPTQIGESVPDEPYIWYDPKKGWNVLIKEKAAAGMNASGSTDIHLICPSDWATMGVKTTIAGTIKHEVQHAVDMHETEKDPVGWQTFKTEYRAYLAEGQYANRDDAAPDQNVKGVTGFTARQKGIVEHILASYPAVGEAWEKNEVVESESKTFREAVVAFHGTLPDLSINPINSERLAMFQGRIRDFNPSVSLNTPQIKKLLDDFLSGKGAGYFNTTDKQVIANGKALRSLMGRHLHPEVIKYIDELVK